MGKSQITALPLDEANRAKLGSKPIKSVPPTASGGIADIGELLRLVSYGPKATVRRLR